MRRQNTFPGRILIKVIVFYRKYISPSLPRRCKYQPTCSQYAADAIKVHGAIKGTILTGWRLLRCNPWSRGGVDWVPEKGKWPRKPLSYTELMAYREAGEKQTGMASTKKDGDVKSGAAETPEKRK